MREFIDAIGESTFAVVLVIAILFGAGALGVVWINTIGLAQINAQRQVTTHSQQYVQTQQQVLVNLYSDWLAAPDAAHKEASRLQVCSQATMLDPAEYPAQVAPFIAQNCH